MTIEELRALLTAGLASASADELAAAQAWIEAQAAGYASQAPTTDSVALLEELADARDAIIAELGNRESLGDRQADVLARFAAQPDAEDAAADAGPDETADGDPDDDDTGDTTGDGTDAEGTADDTTGQQPLAAGRRIPMGQMTRGRRRNSDDDAPIQVQGRLRSAATLHVDGMGAVEPDTQLNVEQLYGALAAKARSLGNSRGPVPRQPVARVDYAYPEDRQIRAGNAVETNTRRLRRAQRRVQTRSMKRRTATFAAGGLCAPPDVDYRIPVIGSQARPVRDALLPMQADHGRLTFRPAINGALQTGATGFWTVQDDVDAGTAGDPEPTKSCLAIDCPADVTCSIEAAYHCVELPNMTARFDPDWAESAVEATNVGHARMAENRLLASLRAGSTLQTAAASLGATRDMLFVLDQMVAMIRSVFRMDPEVEPLRLLGPAWARDLMRADLVRAMHTSNPDWLATPAQTINQWMGAAGRNITPSWHLDGLAAVVGPPAVAQQFYSPVVAGAPVPPFPTTAEFFLFGEGDWVFLDGGSLELGVVRDSTLNERNRYQVFAETFEAACYHGPAGTTPRSFRIVIELDPSGLSAGTVTPA